MSATTPAPKDPYYIDSVPMYYDFASNHDNTIGDRFFDMPNQAFDSSPVAYERVRTPLAEINGTNAASRDDSSATNNEQPRQRRVSKTNMVEQFNKEIQKRRSINTDSGAVVKGGTAPAPLRPSGGVPPLKNATGAAHSTSVFRKNINPTVIGTIGIKATPVSAHRVAESNAANSPMRLRPKRNSSLDKERPKEQAAVKAKEAPEGVKEAALAEPMFKPRYSTDKKSAAPTRPPPLQRRSISSVVAGSATGKVAPGGSTPKAVESSKINHGPANKPAPQKSIFASQKPAAKKTATPSTGSKFSMRLRSSTKDGVEKGVDGTGTKAPDDKADTASNKSDESRGRRISHYMAPTISSRRRSNMGLPAKAAK